MKKSEKKSNKQSAPVIVKFRVKEEIKGKVKSFKGEGLFLGYGLSCLLVRLEKDTCLGYGVFHKGAILKIQEEEVIGKCPKKNLN